MISAVTPAVDEVAAAITERVRRGRPGDRLPAERTLAEELAVGRTRLRRALLHLDAAGLLEIRPQVGVFIR